MILEGQKIKDDFMLAGFCGGWKLQTSLLFGLFFLYIFTAYERIKVIKNTKTERIKKNIITLWRIKYQKRYYKYCLTKKPGKLVINVRQTEPGPILR